MPVIAPIDERHQDAPSTARAVPARAAAGASLCRFLIGGEPYALDAAVLGEVVVLEHLVPVPLAPPAVLGLANLRGVPLEVIDAAMLLDLPRGTSGRETVLVLRLEHRLAGIPVDRVERVLSWDRVALIPPPATDEHPLVTGLVEEPGRPGDRPALLLDPKGIAARLDALRLDRHLERESPTDDGPPEDGPPDRE